ncbi:hypothetical protein GCM10011515_27060 [Tsuneonella deserti]|uniref:Uncharacterized protein n=1 Tax=Tsuneonella deserti TaxID=2035528 RepID=A0ABQ1SE88_9SPHN|nr:hypothetical protein GCM10011515_27060 [Tsuneonella deserti]
MVMIASFACVPAIEDSRLGMGGGAAVRAAEAKPERRASGGGGTDFVAPDKQSRVRSTLIFAAKLEGPPALHSRAGARHAGTCRAQPLQRSRCKETSGDPSRPDDRDHCRKPLGLLSIDGAGLGGCHRHLYEAFARLADGRDAWGNKCTKN